MKRTELHDVVILRDRQCVAAALDRSHQCRDKWGEEHEPFDLDKLTLDHVRDQRGRRQDLAEWCIATCSQANVVEHWESANRSLAQAYLRGVQAALGKAA